MFSMRLGSPGAAQHAPARAHWKPSMYQCYERVAAERPRARATVARVAQKLDEVPTEVRHAAKGECSICLSRRAEFGAAAAARPVVVLPCKHAFHAKCLENWFATSLARLSDADDLTCPLCRQAVPAAPLRGV